MNRFDKIYCINLDKRKDRWNKCIQEFKTMGISDNVKRFSAIEHKFGIAGCTLSHLQIIKESKKNRYKNVLIFEDDIEFLHVNNFNKILNNSFTQMKKMGIKYDMFYLGGNIGGNGNKKINSNLVKLNNVKTTIGYIISHTIYDKIINGLNNIDVNNPNNWLLSNPNRYAIDHWYTQHIHPICNIYGVYPMLINHSAGYSDISNKLPYSIDDNFSGYYDYNKMFKLKNKWDNL